MPGTLERPLAAAIAVRRPRWLVALTELTDVTAYAGGIGRTFAALLPALVAAGVDVDLVLLGRDDPATRPVAGLPFRVVDNGRLKETPLLGPLDRALRVRRAVRRGRYDVVFAPEWEGLGALLPAGTPLITNLATSLALIADISDRRPSLRRPRQLVSHLLQDALETRQIHRSRGVIGISDVIVDWNREHLADVPVSTVVRNCVDLDAVRRLADVGRRPPGWPAGRTVAFLGRLEERKGVRVALAAFAEFGATHSNAHLVLIGGLGDPAKELTRDGVLAAVPAALRRRVHLLGHLSGADLYGALAAADVVMTPSLWEGFGNVGLEVKACGTPLVATSGSGFEDFNTDGEDALLVPPGDAAALAAAVARLLDDEPLRRRIAAAGAASVDAFAPAPVAADLVQAVELLLRRSAR